MYIWESRTFVEQLFCIQLLFKLPIAQLVVTLLQRFKKSFVVAMLHCRYSAL